MVAFINNNVAVVLDERGDRVVFFIDQALVGGYVDNATRLSLATAYTANVYFG